MRKLILLVLALIIVLGLVSFAEKYSPQLQNYLSSQKSLNFQQQQPVKIVTEESVTIDIVKKVGPSVVTITEQTPTDSSSFQDQGPFSFFDFPSGGDNNQPNQPSEPQSIGSGFILSTDGMIVTNKHVVSDTSGKYQVITSDDKKYDVQKIYRDPLNDVALIKIDPTQNNEETLKPVVLGDSSHLQVGQFVVAIGTALGEFRNTVTTGVISGLGRGITAGSDFEGFVEQLNNVIQTDAAINPGNSGGPLLNSSGQVVGVNTAVSQSGQNIGFALPISVIKDSLSNFNQTGQFNRPYLGIAYKVISQDLAILNDVPEGAYISDVISSSPADKAGLQSGDIILKIDGQRLSGNNQGQLSTIISKKKVGDSVKVNYWRDGKTQNVIITLEAAPAQ